MADAGVSAAGSAPGQISDADEEKAAAVLRAIAEQGASVFFEKPLTNSDTAGAGRVVIPKVGVSSWFCPCRAPSW
jgi:hypothetical protein